MKPHDDPAEDLTTYRRRIAQTRAIVDLLLAGQRIWLIGRLDGSLDVLRGRQSLRIIE